MPAHLRLLPVRRCAHPYCDKPATHELRNGANAVIAPYCDRHGPIALERFRATNETGPS